VILGFAHITKNVPVELLADAGVPSAPEKWPLMARRATAHRLTLQKIADVPVELVEYDTGAVEKPSRLSLNAGLICVVARERSEMSFLCVGVGFCLRTEGMMGGAKDAYILHLESAVQSWRAKVCVALREDAPIDPPLDIAGYAALAFYSSDVEADRDHLLKHGGRTPTEPFTVTLDREMKVVMLRSPEGTIIELIQVMGVWQ
jgi:hypothetical protein